MVFLKCKCWTQAFLAGLLTHAWDQGARLLPPLRTASGTYRPLRFGPPLLAPHHIPLPPARSVEKWREEPSHPSSYMRSVHHGCPQDHALSHSRPPPHTRASATLVTCSAISRAAHCHHRPILFLIPTCISSQASPPD